MRQAGSERAAWDPLRADLWEGPAPCRVTRDGHTAPAGHDRIAALVAEAL